MTLSEEDTCAFLIWWILFSQLVRDASWDKAAKATTDCWLKYWINFLSWTLMQQETMLRIELVDCCRSEMFLYNGVWQTICLFAIFVAQPRKWSLKHKNWKFNGLKLFLCPCNVTSSLSCHLRRITHALLAATVCSIKHQSQNNSRTVPKKERCVRNE